MNTNSQFQRHMANMARGGGVTPSNGRYSYIHSEDELTETYKNVHADLGYALRKEVKRDRYVLNAAAMKEYQKEVQKVIINSLMNYQSMVGQMVGAEIVDNITGALGGRRKHSQGTDFAVQLGRMLGTSLVQLAFKFFG